MKKKIVSAVFVAAIAIAAGYTMKQNAEKNDLSDIALANVEALASGESGSTDREDCERASDICEEMVIYPDGYWGLDILLDHKKKPGWL